MSLSSNSEVTGSFRHLSSVADGLPDRTQVSLSRAALHRDTVPGHGPLRLVLDRVRARTPDNEAPNTDVLATLGSDWLGQMGDDTSLNAGVYRLYEHDDPTPVATASSVQMRKTRDGNEQALFDLLNTVYTPPAPDLKLPLAPDHPLCQLGESPENYFWSVLAGTNEVRTAFGNVWTSSSLSAVLPSGARLNMALEEDFAPYEAIMADEYHTLGINPVRAVETLRLASPGVPLQTLRRIKSREGERVDAFRNGAPTDPLSVMFAFAVNLELDPYFL